MTEPTTDKLRPLTIICAMTPFGVIGDKGKIPWRISDDLKRLKALTTGHAIIMGRKTLDSIGRPLPNRTSIVLSRKRELVMVVPATPEAAAAVSALSVCSTVEQALKAAYAVDTNPFVIGGAEIYWLFLPIATNLEFTYVLKNGVTGDAYFPMFATGTRYPDVGIWECTKKETLRVAEDDGNVDIEYHSFVRRP